MQLTVSAYRILTTIFLLCPISIAGTKLNTLSIRKAINENPFIFLSFLSSQLIFQIFLLLLNYEYDKRLPYFVAHVTVQVLKQYLLCCFMIVCTALAGYTVSSVIIGDWRKLYIAGAPRFRHKGKVILFDLTDDGDVTIFQALNGEQVQPTVLPVSPPPLGLWCPTHTMLSGLLYESHLPTYYWLHLSICFLLR